MNNWKVTTSDGTAPNVSYYGSDNSTLVLDYPCTNTVSCTNYLIDLQKGVYKFELYGASAGSNTNSSTTMRTNSGTSCISNEIVNFYGGNTQCSPNNSPGSGGYISGVITLRRRTTIYAYVGGQGQVCSTSEKLEGGFNGGGAGIQDQRPSTSGGGATDIRIEKDDLWHRVIVAGGGGGCDNVGAIAGANDDGSGGAGGYPNSQSYWINGEYQNSGIATQLYGFSFGQGESAGTLSNPHLNSSAAAAATDRPGAGGGWFGGHTGRHGNGGASGGSSFVLTKNAEIPKGDITTHTGLYVAIETHEYAFNQNSEYAMKSIHYANGIWYGSGRIKITKYPSLDCTVKRMNSFGMSAFRIIH